MPSKFNRLCKEGLIKDYPKFLLDNIQYECINGSRAYGCNDEDSDFDIYAIVIPPKELLFPHTIGVIPGFDKEFNKFDHYEVKKIFSDKKEYGFNIYNIVKYFRLCADANPNMVDSLFVPINCVTYHTKIGTMIRNNRKLFLSKKIRHTFLGYAYQQLSKIRQGSNSTSTKRKELILQYGMDTKFAYHVVRLLEEGEQILRHGDLDLQQSRETLKSIRKGEWKISDIEEYFKTKENQIEYLYQNSLAVPDRVREQEIKQLLIDCLEEYHGNLSSLMLVERGNKERDLLLQIKDIIINNYF